MPGTKSKKKGKASKSARRPKKKGPKEDVKSSTSLPPAVEGPLRCFLRVAITKVSWTTPKLPDATHVRLRWWGEMSSGTLFRPVDGKTQGKAESQTVARFPIRCGPKQFAAYLNDMGSVSVDVLRGSSMVVAGRAQVNEISVMSPQKPISGTYPVFSVKDSQKIAEVQIAMAFEPLITSYDSSSSLPTTDASVLALSRHTDQDSVRSKASHRSTSSRDSSRSDKKKIFPGSSSTEGPFTSGNSKPHSDQVPSDAIPHDVESDYSAMIGHPSKPTFQDKMLPTGQDILRRPLSTLPITSNIRSLPAQQMSNTVPDRLNPDLISALLDRGKKLRDAMIKEELGHHSSSGRPHVNQGTEVTEGQRRIGRRGSTGDLFRELLHGERDEVPVRDGDPTVALSNLDDADDDVEDADTENRAVELLVGDVLSAKDLKSLKALHSGVSPPASVSSHSDDDYSEEEDPLHDNSILEELFYKGVASSSSESLADLLDSDSGDEVESQRLKSARPGKTRDAASPRQTREDAEDASSNGYLDTNAADNASPRRSRGEMKEEEEERDESSQSLSESRTSGSLSLASSRDASHHHRGHSEIDPASGLSVERLTLLGRVHVARVTIDKLSLRSEPASRIPVRIGKGVDQKGFRGIKGKPPRPLTQKKITYFVEYQFPVSEASHGRNGASSGAMATELMRVVSKKASGKEVSFGHRSVFPVQFDGQAVDRWWKQLLVFKVFSKVAGDKHPTMLGVASIPLRSLIQSPDLVTVSELPVKDKTSPSRTTDQDSGQRGNMIGLISVSMELASDSKDFASALAKTRVAEMQGAKIVPLPSSDPRAGLGHLTGQTSSSKHTSPVSQQPRHRGQSGTAVKSPPVIPTGHSEVDMGSSVGDIPDRQTTQTAKTNRDGFEALTLHSLLYVRDGHLTSSSPGHTTPRPHPHPSLQYFSGGRDRLVHNPYLVGRMFWLDDAARSDVCWGTTQPNFDYVQVSPVLLTQSLLERMRNNFTVIEVWDKRTSAQHDQLLGITKLPLHQLYMSYRDQRIGKTLLKSQYPVVAVDNEVPITDPFTGQRCGQLTILLALGSQQQVSALQRLKSIRRDATDVPERPIHYGERAHFHSTDQEVEDSGAVEHVFEVVIEGIQGLPQLEDSVWGEADCFIQYHFPHQQQQLQQQQQQFGGMIQDSSLTLRPHRTATTLCVPDPVFNDVSRHRIVLVQGTPVQRELLTACAGVGGHAGGIPFEVWCRFYYPNVRDQVIAKATLPLAKLCAMVTMQRRGEPSVQTFSLPLRTHQDDQQRAAEEAGPKLHDSGLLDVTVSYRQTVIQHKTHPSRDRDTGSGGPHVSLALTIHRACSLKAAATSLARHDNGMQYPSQVGVNSYIKIQLSFMDRDEVRVTRTIARSFCPEYNHHVELPCPLLLAPREGEEEDDVMSLAEALESAELILQVWHQVPGLRLGGSERPHHIEDTLPRGGSSMMGHRVIAETGDVLIGSSTIHLVKLLANRTGLEGWFPVSLPPVGWDTTPLERRPPDPLSDTPDDTPQPHPKLLDRVAGGVELAVKFGQQGDRERVIDAGRKVGWSPGSLVLEDVEQIWDDGLQDPGLTSSLTCEVTIDVDAAWFPVQSSLRPGQTQLDPHTKAYIRYKFYDKGAVCSKLCYLDQTGQGQLCADLKHCHVLHANQSQSFAWYLREEQLEVQLWLSYNSELPKESKIRPRHRDKLIGCAYIDLSPLCRQRVKRHRVSGVFPLFKPGCADMGGACLRAHVTMKVTSEQRPVTTQQPERVRDQESLDEETQPSDGIKNEEEVKEDDEEEDETQKNQPVWMTVVVERAMHINDFTDPSRVGSIAPSSYVTFQSAVGPSPAITPTVPSSNNPQWKYTRDVAISPQLLDKQSLIFKIWHQVSSKQDSTCDRVLGFTSVDLGPLLAGIRSLDGWYNIMDFSGQTLGQIKISITPKESLSPLRHSPKQRAMLGSPNSSNLFSRAPLPPPHYLRSSSNQPSSSLPSTHPAVRSLDHFQQHLEGVREFHGKLQERLRSLHRMETESGSSSEDGIQHTVTQDPPGAGIQQSDYRSHLSERTPSSSYLLENFRKNMEELDVLHQHLKTKLSGGRTSSSSAMPNATSAAMLASHHHANTSSDAERRQFSTDGEQDGEGRQYGAGNVMVGDRTMPQGNENNNQQHHHPHHHHHESGHDAVLGDGEERTDVREDSERTSNWSTEGYPSDEALHEHDDRDGGSGGGIMEDARRGKVTMNPKDDDNSMRRKDVVGDDDDDDDDGGGGGRYQFQEDGAEGDYEDSMVYVRPLNDVSSAAFSNGISDDVISPPSSPPTDPPHYPPHYSSSSHRSNRYTSEKRNEDEQHHQRYDEVIPSDASDEHLLGRDRVSGRTDVEEYQGSNTRDHKEDLYHANQNFDAFHGGMGGDGEEEDVHSHQGSDPVPQAGFDGMDREMIDDDHAQRKDALQGFRTDDLQKLDTQSDHTDSASNATRTRSSTGTGGSGPDDDWSNERVRGGSHDDDVVEDGIVLTLNAQEAELQRRQLELEEAERSAAVRPKVHSKNASSTLPDFFLPPTDLEASMRALYNTVSGPPSHELSARDRAKFEAAQEMAQRLGSGGHERSQAPSRTTLPFSFKQPTADQAKRIAKIFSTKF